MTSRSCFSTSLTARYSPVCKNCRKKTGMKLIFTDRVRSTRREVIVSLCLSVHTYGGGGYPARSSQGWEGGTSARGVTQDPPWPGQVPGGGTEYPGQHMEYLISSGRYAACVHAGGLSCLYCIYYHLCEVRSKLRVGRLASANTYEDLSCAVVGSRLTGDVCHQIFNASIICKRENLTLSN